MCGGVVALLTVHMGLLVHLGDRYSPTVDEVGHLPAGLAVWELGRFDVFRVNPPLVRTIAAFPVWLADPVYDWSLDRIGLTDRPEWDLGRALILANGEPSLRYWAWARWMLVPVSAVGGLVCFCWARDLYGPISGLMALTLWCFSPTVLGYGALITPDLSAAAAGVAAGYAFWLWLREPTFTRTVTAGIVLGLAQLTKMTWIVMFGLWPLLWLVREQCTRQHEREISGRSESAGGQRSPSESSSLNHLGKLALILILGLYALNLGYGFQGTLERLGSYRFISHALSGQSYSTEEVQGGNRFTKTWLAGLPIPLPRDYVAGMDLQKWEFERGNWSYLRGEWKHGGWWWYYLYAAAVKEPAGAWCLLGMAIIATWKVPKARAHPLDTLVVLSPAVIVFLLVSSQTGFNRYLRYVLPAFPFVWIWASQAARLCCASPWKWVVPVGGALAWSTTSSLWIYPHSLSYFNELVGGPAGGHRHLIDANIDWGQDLLELRNWVREHPDALPISVVCQPFVPLEIMGWKVATVSEVLEPGWFIVSRHDRHRRDEAWACFDRLEPVDQIGESMDVYRISDNTTLDSIPQRKLQTTP